MKLNTLRIEPHIVTQNYDDDWLIPLDDFVLWKVWLNDVLISEQARPFKSTDSVIELSTDIQSPIWYDGLDYVSVREMGNYIVWFSHLESLYVYDKRAWNGSETPIFFVKAHYYSVCHGAISASAEINKPLKDFGDKKDYLKTQQLSRHDWKVLINMNYPKSYSAIYLNVGDDNFGTGGALLRAIQRVVDSHPLINVGDPPEKQIELRIGLDEVEFTEAIWHIGKVNGQFAIYFEHLPSFPVWLQSPEFDKILQQESFTEDL